LNEGLAPQGERQISSERMTASAICRMGFLTSMLRF